MSKFEKFETLGSGAPETMGGLNNLGLYLHSGATPEEATELTRFDQEIVEANAAIRAAEKSREEAITNRKEAFERIDLRNRLDASAARLQEFPKKSDETIISSNFGKPEKQTKEIRLRLPELHPDPYHREPYLIPKNLD